MSEQAGKGNGESPEEEKGAPEGYLPPSYIPPAETAGKEPDSGQTGQNAFPPPAPPPSASGDSQPGQTQYGQPPVTPYGQPPTQSQYGQAPYGQPQYGQPQYGQPQYGQPEYGQSPYGQPPVSPYGQPGYYGVPTEPKGLSIASLVCGLVSVFLGWFILPQLGAIVLGHLALGREPSGKGMSITGLVLGYLCLLGYGLFWIFALVFTAQFAEFR